MSLFRKIPAFIIGGVVALSLVAVPVVMAQGGDQQSGGGSGLQLSPTRTEITATPGESKTFTMSLKNVTQGDVTAKAFLNDFESDGQSGTPKIIVDENKDKTPFSIKQMITDLEDINIKPGETKQIEHTVTIPANAAPGAYFGALRYAAVPAGQESASDERKVSLTASVAHLVFVEIPGDVVQKIELSNVEAVGADGKKVPFYQAPTSAAVTVKNLGNGFSRPFGKVTVYRGSTTVHSYDVNNTDPKGIVLPQSSRTFTDEMKNVKTPGKYKISAGVAYGNGGEVVSFEKSFWYLPLWFLGVLAFAVILLVVGGFLAYKKFLAPKSNRA